MVPTYLNFTFSFWEVLSNAFCSNFSIKKFGIFRNEVASYNTPLVCSYIVLLSLKNLAFIQSIILHIRVNRENSSSSSRCRFSILSIKCVGSLMYDYILPKLNKFAQVLIKDIYIYSCIHCAIRIGASLLKKLFLVSSSMVIFYRHSSN